MSMFKDISCDKKDYEEECLANAEVVSLCKEVGTGQWSFSGPGSEKSGHLWKRTLHKESGTKSRKRCWWNSLRVDVQFSVLRLHCPEVNSEAKRHGKLSIHFAADQETIETFFRIIVSANQLSLYGAVANMCEECESLHDRSGQLDKVMDNLLFQVKSRQKYF